MRQKIILFAFAILAISVVSLFVSFMTDDDSGLVVEKQNEIPDSHDRARRPPEVSNDYTTLVRGEARLIIEVRERVTAAPVRGAIVELNRNGTTISKETTNEDGRTTFLVPMIEFENCAPDWFTIVVSSTDYKSMTIGIDQGSSVVLIELERKHNGGMIINAAGSGIAGVDILAYSLSHRTAPTSTIDATATLWNRIPGLEHRVTDAAGRFFLSTELSRGYFVVKKAGYGIRVIGGSDFLRNDYQCVLIETGVVRGRVIESSGLGLRGVEIALTISEPILHREYTETDENGYFLFPKPLSPFSLMFRKDGYYKSSIDVDDDEIEFLVTMNRGRTLQITPRADAALSDPHVMRLSLRVVNDGKPGDAYVLSGRCGDPFVFHGIPEGTLIRILVEHDSLVLKAPYDNLSSILGNQFRIPEHGDVDLEIELQPGAEIYGTVRDDSQLPVSGVQIEFLPRSAATGVGADSQKRRTISSSDGTFKVTGLFPTTIMVRIIDDYWATFEDVSQSTNSLRRFYPMVSVVAGGSHSLDLTVVRASSVSGRVTDVAGNPIVGASIEAELRSRDIRLGVEESHGRLALKTTTDDSGRFSFKGLIPSASYRIKSSHLGHCSLAQDITSEPGNDSIVDFQMDACAFLELAVVDFLGDPVSGVRVRASSIGEAFRSEWNESGVGGKITLGGLKPGFVGIELDSASLPANSSVPHEISIMPIRVSLEGTTRATIVLRQSHEIQCRLQRESGSPLENFRVHIETYIGNSRKSQFIWSDVDGQIKIPIDRNSRFRVVEARRRVKAADRSGDETLVPLDQNFLRADSGFMVVTLRAPHNQELR